MPDEPSTVIAVTAACKVLVDLLDRLAPDAMSAEECVAVVALLTKGPEAITTVAKSTKELLELRLADLIPAQTAVPVGGYTVRSKPGSPTYRNWDSERLLMDVLDSRRFDPGTGELIEESPTDKLMHVFGLSGSAARKTALKERGINPADYAEVQRADKVEVI